MAQVSLILESFADPEPRRPFPIEKDGFYAITKCADDVSIDINCCDGEGELEENPACLALLSIYGTHVTLRSACESCAVIPPNVEDHKIALERSTSKCHYSVVLRPDDRIVLWSKAPRVPRDCTLKVQINDVQVESSLPGSVGQLERRTQQSRAPAATPLAASTTSQVVNETPASRRKQHAPGNGSSSDGDVAKMDDRMIAPEEHEEDDGVLIQNDSTDAPEEDADDSKVFTMNGHKNSPKEHASQEQGIRSSVRRSSSTKHDHVDVPEDYEEEDDTTASESENEDEPNEEQTPPSNSNEKTVVRQDKRRASQRMLSPRVEIPATRGYKRAAQEDSPRAIKKRAVASETPPSSARSHRSAVKDHDETGENKSLRVAFSNSTVTSRPSTLKFLSRKGVSIQDSVTNACDYLCVNASGHLLKSFKLLMSVILGKPIISEEWVVKSINAKDLVDPDDFITTNAPSEWEWGNSREEVADALGRDRSNLFEGFDILVTPKLKKEYGDAYKDVEKLLKRSGAATVVSKQARAQDPSSSTVVIGSDSDDADVTKLSDSDDGWSCFSKELISMSILRGRLDLQSNEFRLQPSKSGKKTGKPGRPKKSK